MPINGDEMLLRSIAQKFTGRERHRLSDDEREIVKMLEDAGFLTARTPTDGFIGEVARPKGRGY